MYKTSYAYLYVDQTLELMIILGSEILLETSVKP
jgi:hypothetical protein